MEWLLLIEFARHVFMIWCIYKIIKLFSRVRDLEDYIGYRFQDDPDIVNVYKAKHYEAVEAIAARVKRRNK